MPFYGEKRKTMHLERGNFKELIQKQPWFHSPIVDSFGIYLFPMLITVFLYFFGDNFSPVSVAAPALLFGTLDLGHIFAQWFRIKSNPMEKPNRFRLWITFCIVMLFVIAFILSTEYWRILRAFLVYYVIYHFIKQLYGIIKIYSKTDIRRSKLETKIIDIFVYLTMLYPFIYWHDSYNLSNFYWRTFLYNIPYISYIEIIARFAFLFSGLFYIYSEVKNTIQNKFFNIPKNMTIAATILAWNASIIFPKFNSLIFYAVIYTHYLNYVVVVWSIGRRDKKLQGIEEPKGWRKLFCWTSVPGFFTYSFFINAIAIFIYTFWLWVAHYKLYDSWLYKEIIIYFPQIKNRELFWWHVVDALFYTTQGTHYFIDGFLWKKEKDYAWHLRQESLKAQPQT